MSDDSFVEVTNQGWFSRILESIKGVLFGLLLIVVSVGVLFWNEGRAVKTAKSLTEGASAVMSVPADNLNAANEGKLIHVTGQAETAETLSDPEFAVSLPCLKLRRAVEMYQWKETSNTKEVKKLGGGTEKTTQYDYALTWSENMIKSSDFKKQEGHQNPGAMRFEPQSWTATTAMLGVFTLTKELIDKIDVYEDLAVTDSVLAQIPSGLRADLKKSGSYLYIGPDPSTPKVGDLRIKFATVKPQAISVIAQQTGKSFSPYATKAGDAIQLLTVGTHSADQMFQAAQSANKMMTWILRLVGFVLIFVGFSMIFAPLATVADVVPFIGSIVGLGTGIAAFFLAVPVTLMSIAVAWIFFRPLLGISLMIVAIAMIGFGISMGLKKRKATV